MEIIGVVMSIGVTENIGAIVRSKPIGALLTIH